MSETTCILIPSCDAYSDAWKPFFELLFRYWPDCPYPIVLVSEREVYEHPRVRNISLGSDAGWASNVLRALPELGVESILYLQEDYFLTRKVETQRLRDVFAYAAREGCGYVRLAGAPDPQLQHDNAFGLGEMQRGAAYRCSLQASWWNVETLRALLVPGESGWEMEKLGSPRSNELPETFLSVYTRKPLLHYYFYTGILKGKWCPAVLRQLRREGIAVDTTRRPVQPRLRMLRKQIRRWPPIARWRRFVRSSSRRSR